jgi:hypothetical protein
VGTIGRYASATSVLTAATVALATAVVGSACERGLSPTACSRSVFNVGETTMHIRTAMSSR